MAELNEVMETVKSASKDPECISLLTDRFGGEYSFMYEGTTIHANKFPDSWSVVGMGDNWFAVRTE